MKNVNTISLDQVGLNDLSLVGGKNASLGEMISNLQQSGIRVPEGYAVTVNAFKTFLNYNQLGDKIKRLLHEYDISDLAQLQEVAQKIPLDLLSDICCKTDKQEVKVN